MSSVDSQEAKVCSILCTCENPKKHRSQLSTADNDSKYCDSVSNLNIEKQSHIVTGTQHHDKYLLTSKYIIHNYLCRCSHIVFSYLSHLTTFSWQRRKRRRLASTKEDQKYVTRVTNLISLVSFLVLSSSFSVSPINATVSYPPESIRLPSYNLPHNDSQAQYLVPSSNNAEATGVNWLESKNNMPSQIGEGALRSRTQRGNKL